MIVLLVLHLHYIGRFIAQKLLKYGTKEQRVAFVGELFGKIGACF